ncbi:MAG: MATE family efflux transporter [Prevotellaceae bacterium]|jgi:putative MATE family efflux protein|nr:MATE family efflux transporter [Prevotellaceae bacterium]
MQSSNAPTTLGTENIGKLLMQYAFPAIVAMTAASLYNITDSIFIGRGVNSMALAGLAITFPLMNLSAAFGSLVGMGASTLLSIRLGQKDYETANTILGNVVTLNILVGVVFTVITLLFLDPILIFFGASPATLPHAHNFMVIIMGGNAITHLYFGLNALLRSSGHPTKAMMATVFSVMINIVLNPFFIFVLKLGIRGSAMATVISQIVVLCWQIHIFNDKDFFIHWQKGIYRIRAKIFKDSFAIGLAPFLMNAASCLIVILINRKLTKYGGDIAVSAYGIVNRVAFLFVMIVIGINQGMQPIAGYNYGAKLQSRVVEVLKKSIFFATIVMVVGTVVIQLFPHVVSSVFSHEQELIDVAANGLRWVFFCYPLVGFQMVSSAFFQSIGKPNKAIILSVTRQVLFLIPLLLILPTYLHVTGVWVSMTISDFISVILTAVLLFSEFRNKSSVS